MSVIDILTRVDAICKKYGKYDVDEHKHLNVSADTDAALQVQWHSTELLAARNNLALALPDSTQAIGAPKLTGGWTTSASRTEIKFDSDRRFESEQFQQTGQFRQEYVLLKMKQAFIILGFMLEMYRQVPLMDEINKFFLSWEEVERNSSVSTHILSVVNPGAGFDQELWLCST
ncbi:hypothetical protein RHSIM_Rhsim05G0183200 [Rhododendron simsii]|uniref:Uncharacterized protein n=1 Tax=Rhododendron simsii TaxID=118357 RepID=A0A834GVM6_RHOSS|nr:hypothetical protein RHSIM_Rhsim05G0183200 [Rhododendron simsii]